MGDDGGLTTSKNISTVARLLFVLLLAIYLLSASLRIDSGDGETMYRVANSLSCGRGLAIPIEESSLKDGRTGYGQVGRAGRYYAKYGLGWPLVASPFAALGRWAARLHAGVTKGFATRTAIMVVNPLLTSAAAVLLLNLATRIYFLTTSTALSLLFGLATITWYYAKSAFSEPLVTLLLLSALLAVERGRLLTAGLALGGMIMTRQTAALLVAPVAGWALLRLCSSRSRPIPRRIAALLLPILLFQLLALGHNAYRFGSPFDFGYSTATWDTPLAQGLYRQLIGPGKGLFVFMPVLLLGAVGWPALRQRRPNWAWLVLSAVAIYLLPHAVYGEWTGGGGWGPRLLVPIVPLVLLPAGCTIERWKVRSLGRAALVFVTAVSIVIQILGVSVNWGRHLQAVRETSATDAEFNWRVYDRWPDSPIPGQVTALRSSVGLLVDPQARRTVADLVNPAVGSPIRDWQTESVGLLSFNVPDFWFVYLWFLGVPVPALGGALLLLVGTAIAAGRALHRHLAHA